MEDRTTLVIAHRFSTVKKCNPLLVLEKGHLVEKGTHEDLLSHGGLYAKLSKLQFQANESA
jgi:ATP-binding cassette, subfamily B, bacterial